MLLSILCSLIGRISSSIEVILEAFDVQFSHQGAEFDDAGDGDADADFERGP